MWGRQIHTTKFWTGNYSSNVTSFELLHQYHENITNIIYYTMHRLWGTRLINHTQHTASHYQGIPPKHYFQNT